MSRNLRAARVKLDWNNTWLLVKAVRSTVFARPDMKPDSPDKEKPQLFTYITDAFNTQDTELTNELDRIADKYAKQHKTTKESFLGEELQNRLKSSHQI
ncbi:MAG: hypothetical protein JSS50_01755 [Proteobacteria bacterium]|nr:hypothetical protein [Pseudomonadota bacterium]